MQPERKKLDLDGKIYVRVKDYQLMRKGVGMLLAEIMRIKAEGDYDAIKTLVDKYGTHFDPALRRYQDKIQLAFRLGAAAIFLSLLAGLAVVIRRRPR